MIAFESPKSCQGSIGAFTTRRETSDRMRGRSPFHWATRIHRVHNLIIFPSSRPSFRALSFVSMSRSLAVPRDVREFLDGYPEGHDDSDLSANFEFYSNKRTCRPDNLLIEDLHER